MSWRVDWHGNGGWLLFYYIGYSTIAQSAVTYLDTTSNLISLMDRHTNFHTSIKGFTVNKYHENKECNESA